MRAISISWRAGTISDPYLGLELTKRPEVRTRTARGPEKGTKAQAGKSSCAHLGLDSGF
jgi:hypothetical protein